MPDAFHSNILKYADKPPDRPPKTVIQSCLNKIQPMGPLPKKLGYSLILIIISLTSNRLAWSFNLFDLFEIGSAYLTHLTIHEMGHQIVADEVGATNHKITFFTEKKGDFYLGLSTYDSIPSESRLPYAMGGERMNSISYEYHLAAYRRNPTIFNKTMLFFDTTSFLGYTLLANYVNPDNKGYDPTLIRTEIGMSKELMLSFVLTKTALNTWRIYHPEMRWTPVLESDFESVKFKLVYCF